MINNPKVISAETIPTFESKEIEGIEINEVREISRKLSKKNLIGKLKNSLEAQAR